VNNFHVILLVSICKESYMRGWIKKWTRLRELTVEEKQEITTQQMERMITDLFHQMKLVYLNGQKQVYRNPLGLTREQVIVGFGAGATELIRLATLLKDCLNIASPGTIADGPDEYGLGGDVQKAENPSE
jgi:hypothetical protein